MTLKTITKEKYKGEEEAKLDEGICANTTTYMYKILGEKVGMSGNEKI